MVLRFFDRDFVVKLLLLLLLSSLVLLAEAFLLQYVGDHFGEYLSLAVAASTGLFGLIIALREFRVHLEQLRRKAKAGLYPSSEFASLAGVLIGACLLLLPGFITDLAGLVLFLPPARNGVGNIVARKLAVSFKEIYEYLKLYDF